MALRTPLVLNAGVVQQLQAGDTLNAPQDGTSVYVLTNANASSIVIGTPVYSSANDSVDKAEANASATKDVIGLVNQTTIATSVTGTIAVAGVLVATTTQWDAVAGTTGGLTKNTRYYLSGTTAGQLTATAPSTVGQYVVEVGIALSTTEMIVAPKTPILL